MWSETDGWDWSSLDSSLLKQPAGGDGNGSTEAHTGSPSSSPAALHQVSLASDAASNDKIEEEESYHPSPPAESEYHDAVLTTDPIIGRPLSEPPILDYNKVEEGGRMYHSWHRHHDIKPEEWYAYADIEMERKLLGDHVNWAKLRPLNDRL